MQQGINYGEILLHNILLVNDKDGHYLILVKNGESGITKSEQTSKLLSENQSQINQNLSPEQIPEQVLKNNTIFIVKAFILMTTEIKEISGMKLSDLSLDKYFNLIYDNLGRIYDKEIASKLIQKIFNLFLML